MARRSRARETALQLLYRQDLNPAGNLESAGEFIEERLEDQALRDFCWKLFTGALEWRNVIDTRIEEVAANWSLRRMAPTDRNVLRLGAYELLYTDTPNRVVIDESLELAKKFGNAQSSQFVNGILDQLMPTVGDESPDAPTQAI
jgi:transcription antitermination protein NusB